MPSANYKLASCILVSEPGRYDATTVRASYILCVDNVFVERWLVGYAPIKGAAVCPKEWCVVKISQPGTVVISSLIGKRSPEHKRAAASRSRCVTVCEDL